MLREFKKKRNNKHLRDISHDTCSLIAERSQEMSFVTFYGLHVGVYNVTAEAGRVKGTLNGLKNECGSL